MEEDVRERRFRSVIFIIASERQDIPVCCCRIVIMGEDARFFQIELADVDLSALYEGNIIERQLEPAE